MSVSRRKKKRGGKRTLTLENDESFDKLTTPTTPQPNRKTNYGKIQHNPNTNHHPLPTPHPHPPPKTISLRNAALLTAAFALLLWLIHFVDALLLPTAIKPGVYPRTIAGLVGIPLAPLVHGSFEHLISNTLPLLLLGTGMLFLYPRASQFALPFLHLAPGVGVWLFARDAYHLGASGLVYGMMFFLLVVGMLRKDRGSVGFSTAVLFLYSGMLIGLLPEDSGISFEYHLFGALAGAACAFALRAHDPQPPAEKYDWEDDDSEDPVIGDQWRLPVAAPAESPPPYDDDSHDDELEPYYMDEEDALLDPEWYEEGADDGDINGNENENETPGEEK